MHIRIHKGEDLVLKAVSVFEFNISQNSKQGRLTFRVAGDTDEIVTIDAKSDDMLSVANAIFSAYKVEYVPPATADPDKLASFHSALEQHGNDISWLKNQIESLSSKLGLQKNILRAQTERINVLHGLLRELSDTVKALAARPAPRDPAETATLGGIVEQRAASDLEEDAKIREALGLASNAPLDAGPSCPDCFKAGRSSAARGYVSLFYVQPDVLECPVCRGRWSCGPSGMKKVDWPPMPASASPDAKADLQTADAAMTAARQKVQAMKKTSDASAVRLMKDITGISEASGQPPVALDPPLSMPVVDPTLHPGRCRFYVAVNGYDTGTILLTHETAAGYTVPHYLGAALYGAQFTVKKIDDYFGAGLKRVFKVFSLPEPMPLAELHEIIRQRSFSSIPGAEYHGAYQAQ